jgi:hypothetical protein
MTSALYKLYENNKKVYLTMAVEKTNSSSSLAEVIDRILDKGIVIDAWASVLWWASNY